MVVARPCARNLQRLDHTAKSKARRKTRNADRTSTGTARVIAVFIRTPRRVSLWLPRFVRPSTFPKRTHMDALTTATGQEWSGTLALSIDLFPGWLWSPTWTQVR